MWGNSKAGPWLFQGQGANDFYQDMIQRLRADGEPATPRGLPTLELLHVVTRVENPRRRVLSQFGRRLNPFFNLAESLWIATGHSEAEWICYYNSQLKKYLDPPFLHFHGAYGERLRCWPRVARWHGHALPRGPQDQLLDCCYLLRDDPDSRQAVMVLWNPEIDNRTVLTVDRPCNDAVAFKIRGGRLWMTVFSRSNDVILGLTSTNIVQFTTLQELLASWLGLCVGPYTHYSDSLHLYRSQPVDLGPPFDVYEYVDPTPMRSQTVGDSDSMLRRIYATAGGWQKDPESRSDTLQEGISCPYWRSVAWALAAYVWHRRKDGEKALRCVGAMTAFDWQVECLRFLVDRYGDDRDFQGGVARVLSGMTARGGLEGRQALWRYIFQSHPSEPWGDISGQ